MLTLKAKSIYNDYVGIKVADFILTITLYIDKCLSLTTAIVSDRFSFAEENIMENNDLISREYIRKALNEAFGCENATKYGNKNAEQQAKSYSMGFQDGVKKVLSERPQVEWIPVSERLPDKNGRCLVTTDFGDVCMDSFVDNIFVMYRSNVVAWQPLPEPYMKCGTNMRTESEDK